jgi:hypothetical protein
MEDKIAEILSKREHEMAGHSWLLGLDRGDCLIASKEITQHVFEFIRWLIDSNYIMFDGGSDKLHFDEDAPKAKYYYTLEGMYEYWLNNIHNER